MQDTQSAGQPGSTQTAPAAAGFLDSQNEMAVPSPQGQTDEAHNSASNKAPGDGEMEFDNAAHGNGASHI